MNVFVELGTNMPTYVYACNSCGRESEHVLKVEDRDALVGVACYSCSKGTMFRAVTACAFKVKGACAANGYSTNIADIEKRLGREVNNNDFPE